MRRKVGGVRKIISQMEFYGCNGREGKTIEFMKGCTFYIGVYPTFFCLDIQYANICLVDH